MSDTFWLALAGGVIGALIVRLATQRRSASTPPPAPPTTATPSYLSRATERERQLAAGGSGGSEKPIFRAAAGDADDVPARSGDRSH